MDARAALALQILSGRPHVLTWLAVKIAAITAKGSDRYAHRNLFWAVTYAYRRAMADLAAKQARVAGQIDAELVSRFLRQGTVKMNLETLAREFEDELADWREAP